MPAGALAMDIINYSQQEVTLGQSVVLQVMLRYIWEPVDGCTCL